MKTSIKMMLLLLLVGLLVLAGCSQGNKQAAQETTAQNAAQDTQNAPKEAGENEKQPDKEKAFYDGENITLIVATKPGGGYDLYARLLAPKLKKYLRGSTVIVKNVPGAGHIIGANEIYNAKPDGLTFGTFNKGLITNQIVGMEGIKFDFGKMSWLGSPASEPRLLVISKQAPFKTMEDVIKGDKTVIMATGGVGSASHTDVLFLAEILDVNNFKLIPGYSGNEADLAMLRGEVHGQIGSIDSMLPIIKSGDAIPILVIGNKPLKEFPDVPLISEYTKEEDKPLTDLMVTQALLSRPYAGPPNIPADRLAVLKEAFEKAWNDPQLLAEAEKAGIPIELTPGDEVTEIVKGALNQPDTVVKLLKEIVKEE